MIFRVVGNENFPQIFADNYRRLPQIGVVLRLRVVILIPVDQRVFSANICGKSRILIQFNLIQIELHSCMIAWQKVNLIDFVLLVVVEDFHVFIFQ